MSFNWSDESDQSNKHEYEIMLNKKPQSKPVKTKDIVNNIIDHELVRTKPIAIPKPIDTSNILYYDDRDNEPINNNKFYCRSCQKSYNTLQSLMSHYKTSKHRAKYEDAFNDQK